MEAGPPAGEKSSALPFGAANDGPATLALQIEGNLRSGWRYGGFSYRVARIDRPRLDDAFLSCSN